MEFSKKMYIFALFFKNDDMIARCIEELKINSFTFRVGESYKAGQVNYEYWVVDSVGVKSENFDMHFEVEEDEEEIDATVREFEAAVWSEPIFPEPDILDLDWFGRESEKTSKRNWLDILKDWYNDWEIIQWYE